MSLVSSPYAGPHDLEDLRSFLVSLRGVVGHACWHVGDLTWRLFLHSIRHDLGHTVRLWREDSGPVLAFAVATPPSATDTVPFDLQLAAGHRGRGLEERMVAWVEDLGTCPRPTGEGRAGAGLCLRTDTGVYDHDVQQMAALERLGFERTSEQAVLLVRSLREPVPEPGLPPGWTIRSVAGPAEAGPRTGAHRDAFHPSRLTVEAYLRLMDMPGYAAGRDLVAVAPDGTFAAFCLLWTDAANGVGEFEPVGTRAAFRHQGLARAVLLEGLRRLRAAGLECAIVGPVDVREAAPLRLYRSVGFRPAHWTHFFARRPER